MHDRWNLVAVLLGYTTLHMYFRLMGAVFGFPVTLTSESSHFSPTAFRDPENVGIADGWNIVAGNSSRSAIRATGVSDITSAILISG